MKKQKKNNIRCGHFYKTFQCDGCGINTLECSEYYMIQNELWRKITKRNDDMLCIGCAENRLGRKLKPRDFTECSLNNNNLRGYPQSSARLYKRILGK